MVPVEKPLELVKEAINCLSRNDLAASVKLFDSAISKLPIEEKEIQALTKTEMDEYLSAVSAIERPLALKLTKKMVKANPGWLRGWRRWLLLTLPDELEKRLKESRMKTIDILEKKSSITPSKTPIAVSTRGFNRLEYTTQCVDGVAQQILDFDFVHVVIDQASEDGTEQWFNWLWRNPKPYWSRLGYIRLKQNLGDWGGMVLSHAVIAKKYDRLMQLDNDSKLVSPYSLENLSYALDLAGPKSIVMCRRIGAGDIKGSTGGDVPLLPMSRCYNIDFPHGRSKVYEVNHPVTCYLSERNLVDETIRQGCTAACRFRDTVNVGCHVYKLHDLPAITIQGWDGERYLQHEKYYRGSVSTEMNYLKVSSEEIMNDPKRFIDYTLPPAADKGWLKI